MTEDINLDLVDTTPINLTIKDDPTLSLTLQDTQEISLSLTSVGVGDVSYITGGGAVTDNSLVRFHSTTGTIIQGGTNAPTYDDAGTLTLGVDDPYGLSWNGSLEVPTKNAVYDKIQSISIGSGINVNLYNDETIASVTTLKFKSQADLATKGALDLVDEGSGNARLDGVGDVAYIAGGGSVADHSLVRFDSTSGRIIQGGTNAPTYDDSGNMTVGGTFTATGLATFTAGISVSLDTDLGSTTIGTKNGGGFVTGKDTNDDLWIEGNGTGKVRQDTTIFSDTISFEGVLNSGLTLANINGALENGISNMSEGTIYWDSANDRARVYDGSSWSTLGGGASVLDDLNDVTITSVASGEILKYDGADWINNTLAEAGIASAVHTHTLSDVTDVTATAGELNLLDGATATNGLVVYGDGTAFAQESAFSYDSSTNTLQVGTISEAGDIWAHGNLQVGLSTKVQLKNSSGELQVRNNADSDYADLRVKNLVVEGTTTTIESETVTIADNFIELNSNETGAPTENAGVEVNRGTITNASLTWDESNDWWSAGISGSEKLLVYHADNHVESTAVQTGDYWIWWDTSSSNFRKIDNDDMLGVLGGGGRSGADEGEIIYTVTGGTDSEASFKWDATNDRLFVGIATNIGGAVNVFPKVVGDDLIFGEAIASYTGNFVRFKNSSQVDQFTINSDADVYTVGDVGIGATPTRALHVEKSQASGFLGYLENTSTIGNGVQIITAGTTSSITALDVNTDDFAILGNGKARFNQSALNTLGQVEVTANSDTMTVAGHNSAIPIASQVDYANGEIMLRGRSAGSDLAYSLYETDDIDNTSAFWMGVFPNGLYGPTGTAGLISDKNGTGTVRDIIITANDSPLSATPQITVSANTAKVGINNTSPSATLDVTGTGAFSGDVTVADEAYSVAWDGSLEVPTKNAIYDKIETIGSQNLFETVAGDTGTNAVADSATDTLTIAGGTGIDTSGDSATDTITVALNASINDLSDVSVSSPSENDVLVYDSGNWTNVETVPNADRTQFKVRNETGSTITAGTPVYITGYSGGQDRPLVAGADASSSSTMPAIGVVKEDISNNTNGFCVSLGSVRNINTSTCSVGDTIYVANGGGFTKTKPTGTDLIQNIGKVLKVDTTTGSIEVMGAGRSNDVPNIASANFWLGNASGVATPVTMSGDATIDNTGAVTISSESVQDIAGQMFSGNTETLITATYQDADGTVDLVVDNDLSNYSNATSGFITASSTDTLTNKSGNISQWTNDSGYLTSIAVDSINDTHIDWGTGANQVSADDIPDGSTNAIPTLTQESNWDTAFGWGDHSTQGYLTTVDISANTNLTASDGVLLTGDALSVDISPQTDIGTPASGDLLLIEDITDGSIKKVQIGNLPTGGGGEANTASNVGTAGVGIFKQKTGVDLEFKKLNAGSSKVTITDDTGNNEVDVDIVEANINHDSLSGFVANEHLDWTNSSVGTIHITNIQSASTTQSGVQENATSSEINTGTSAVLTVTPDGLAGSYAGTKTVQMVITDFTADVATGDGKFYFEVPDELGGMDLIRARGRVVTAGTTGSTDIQIHNITQTADMLTSKISIASAGTSAEGTVDTANDDVATDDLLRIDVDAVSTTAPQGLIITLAFRLP